MSSSIRPSNGTIHFFTASQVTARLRFHSLLAHAHTWTTSTGINLNWVSQGRERIKNPGKGLCLTEGEVGLTDSQGEQFGLCLSLVTFCSQDHWWELTEWDAGQMTPELSADPSQPLPLEGSLGTTHSPLSPPCSRETAKAWVALPAMLARYARRATPGVP